jgi:ankyrin repeat protein
MLRKALAREDIRTVKEVIRIRPGHSDCSSEVRRFGDHARTPLYLAVQANDVEALRSFIDAGANPNTRVNNSTPLEWAAVYGRRTEFARLLLSAGTDAIAAESAVLEGAAHGNWEIALFLLSRKAGTHATDSRGWTALHHAAERGNINAVECLLKQGANIDAGTTGTLTIIDPANNSRTRIGPGTTPLRLAEWHQRSEPWSSIAAMLREHGAVSRGSIV